MSKQVYKNLNKSRDECYIYEFRKTARYGHCLISQIKQIYKEVINVLHYQVLLSLIHRKI